MPLSSELFKRSGLLSENLEHYEMRPQQIAMAEAVEGALESEEHLIVEAGTGVGKSLAYLIPSILWAQKENKLVVISTYTKALQTQLFVKDLPFLKRILGKDLRYALCMGSENYLCIRKATANRDKTLFKSKSKNKEVEEIYKWIDTTGTGLISDLEFIPDRAVWDKFSREYDACRGRKCPFSSDCFFIASRKAHAESHVLIVNHALLFADLVSENRILPEFDCLILDEAHMVEDVASDFFGCGMGSSALGFLMDSIREFLKASDTGTFRGFLFEEIALIEAAVHDASVSAEKFFTNAGNILGGEERTARFDKNDYDCEDLKKSMLDLSEALYKCAGSVKKIGEKNSSVSDFQETLNMYAKRCERSIANMDFIFNEERDGYVYWSEVRKLKKRSEYSFYASPVEISDKMNTFLFERIRPVILTSATLSTAGKFDFIKKRLGLDSCKELLVDSPFDYRNKVLLYVPEKGADPNAAPQVFKNDVKDHIVKIYRVMGGRMFALFTSYEMLNDVAASIGETDPDIHLLKQGELPRYMLLDMFKKSRKSILMGTLTFWQGVDVSGDALECVIITKLPFSVPSDPLNAARIEAIRQKGLNPFYEYQLPEAVIMFKQGFGRLIRGHADRGVVAVLDPRIRSRSYGKYFLDAIPKCRVTGDISHIGEFFQSSTQ
ncbi:MAG: helicase C-terminal domain-containing protein [Candidatus Omnitrophica bacterium]|nr:helicase C-terminal domain-containing protein [Candidatus Omnitrophota bacterium]